jgi:hypothetical protein
VEIWRSKDYSEIAVIAATWELKPSVTFESLASEFKANSVKAWRNYGSVVTHGFEAAIKEPNAVLNRVNHSRGVGPWRLAGESGGYLDDFRGRRGLRYFMHFDLSKNRDATGIALVHRERDGRLVVDFMWQHRPRPGFDVNYAELREKYVYPLLGRGFHLECVSFDGFQSDETRQVLEERGIHTDYCSADKDTGPYDTLIDYVLTDRCDFYNFPVFVRELEELRFVNGLKYDHPRKFKNGDVGSKDVADAVACAAFKAVEYALDNPLPDPGRISISRAPVERWGERTPW